MKEKKNWSLLEAKRKKVLGKKKKEKKREMDGRERKGHKFLTTMLSERVLRWMEARGVLAWHHVGGLPSRLENYTKANRVRVKKIGGRGKSSEWRQG